jgi:hypothetical protein
MKNTLAKAILIATIPFAAGAAMADEISFDTTGQYGTPLTRLQVQADLAKAQANREIATGEQAYVAPVAAATLSRQAVRADAQRAMLNGEIANGEVTARPAAVAGSRVAADLAE